MNLFINDAYDIGNQWSHSTDTLDNEDDYNTLLQIINLADQRYYEDDSPLFSDVVYDNLYKKLIQTEKTHPEWASPSSPTQRVSHGLNSQFSKVQHLVPMLSLENSYNPDDLREWDRRCREVVQDVEYSVEPKLDGVSISLVYEASLLSRGSTRGNGVVGDDITPNARQIRSIPLQLKDKKAITIEVRGEVVMNKKVFEAYNHQLASEGLPLMVNPRNAASGSLRMKDPKDVARRKLDAYFYHLSYWDGEELPFQKHTDVLHWLHDNGFSTPIPYLKTCQSIDEVISYVESFEEKRESLPYDIDGMVIKVNTLQDHDILGNTAHHPRWAIAYKFKAKQATTQLETIEFQVGRTGIITPVAKIVPVFVGGVTISSISLFNEDVIKEKNIKLGDTIVVERAGDVIPYVVKSMVELRTGKEKEIIFPTDCPACNHRLHREPDEAAWRCINVSCPAQVEEGIIHFVSKDAMDIKSLGESNVKRFIAMGLISNIADVYKIDYNKLDGLEGFGMKSIEKLREAVNESKVRPIHRIVYALGIKHVGISTAKTLSRHIKNHLMEIKNWSMEELMSMEDVGPKVAQSVIDYFHDDSNLELIQSLEAEGVILTKVKQENTGSEIFAGKTFLFTGTMNMKRSDAEEIVEKSGGKILSTVSSKLDYLIVGENAGSKLDKAKKLGTVDILTEAQFIEMIPTS